MSLTPSAQRTRKLQVLEDLKKIKVKIEDNEAVENMNNMSHSTHVKQEHDLDEGEHLCDDGSSSVLSELEVSESDSDGLPAATRKPTREKAVIAMDGTAALADATVLPRNDSRHRSR